MSLLGIECSGCKSISFTHHSLTNVDSFQKLPMWAILLVVDGIQTKPKFVVEIFYLLLIGRSHLLAYPRQAQNGLTNYA